MMAESNPERSIAVEATLPQTPAAIWKALTASDLIANWLMPNDFEPVLGKLFTFTTRPMQGWDGIVHCKVLEIVPEKRLVYCWKGGSAEAALDSTVTWTLSETPSGTHLRMVHAGFRSPQNDFAYNAMSPGWARIIDRIRVTATESA
jgi:uncharacterized protein YndB with AHSA1/START domain